MAGYSRWGSQLMVLRGLCPSDESREDVEGSDEGQGTQGVCSGGMARHQWT